MHVELQEAGISRCEIADAGQHERQGYCALDKRDRQRGGRAEDEIVVTAFLPVSPGLLKSSETRGSRRSCYGDGVDAGVGFSGAGTGETAGDRAIDALEIFVLASSSTFLSSG